MRAAIILAAIMFVPTGSFSATIIVPDDYTTIQAAIYAAMNGDTVLVKPGTYVENIDFKGKAITVTSEQGADVTIIDGNQAGSVVACTSGEGLDSVLDGFTLTNGYGNSGGGGYEGGGGMYNYQSNPTVKNCAIIGNTAYHGGGGMHNYGSNPTLTNCSFSANSAWGGGGMFNMDNSNPTLTNCNFAGNSAAYGGGMCNYSSSPTVASCTFSCNTVHVSGGGGMFNVNGSSPTVTSCSLFGNSTPGPGGGMLNSVNCSPTVTNCTFSENITGGSGGGGLYNWDNSNPTVTNCIAWNNMPDQIYSENGSNPDVTFCCIQSGYPGIGNIASDPLFVDEVNSDFHLTFNSPCRGSGDNSAVTELHDFEGDPRIAYGMVDMGADEFYNHLYYTGDTVIGGYIELKFVDLPNSFPVGFWIALDAMDIPYSGMMGDWYLLPPYIGPFYLGAIPSNGVYVLPGIIPPLPPAPYTMYMQAIIGGTPFKLTNLCTMDVQ